MQIKSWSAENFFRYGGVIIDTQRWHGLVLVEGKNYDFASSSSNGSGKSSLIEALSFALFGRTLRSLGSKDSVVRSDSDGCRVTVDVEADSDDLSITRYREHKQFGNAVDIKLNGADVRGRTVAETDAKIVQVLGFDFDLFRRAVVIHSRMTESFASLNDRYLKHITERLLGMPDFAAVGQTVKQHLDRLGSRLDLLRERVTSANELLTAEKKKLATYRKRATEFAVELANRERDLRSRMATAENEVARICELLNKLNKQRDRAQEAVAACERSLEAKKVRVQEVDGKLKAGLSELNRVVGRLTGLEASKTRYEQFKERRLCPECEQKVPLSHIEGKRAAAEKEIVALLTQKARLVKEQNEFSKGLRARQADADLASITLGDRRVELGRLSSALGAAKAGLSAAEGCLVELRSEKDQQGSNPFEGLIVESEKTISALEERLEELELKHGRAERLIPYYEFWKHGFGPDGIRSYALDGVTPMLNQLANMYLEQLTDGTMVVELSTVSKNKDGSYRDRFSVAVDNSGGGSVLASNSDGEIASVDFALNMAISDVLDSRVKGGIGLLFIDQLLDLLDEVRSQKAIRLLSQRLDPAWCKQHGLAPKRNVFVISHRNEIKDQFAKVLQVEKRGGVCRIIK